MERTIQEHQPQQVPKFMELPQCLFQKDPAASMKAERSSLSLTKAPLIEFHIEELRRLRLGSDHGFGAEVWTAIFWGESSYTDGKNLGPREGEQTCFCKCSIST